MTYHSKGLQVSNNRGEVSQYIVQVQPIPPSRLCLVEDTATMVAIKHTQ